MTNKQSSLEFLYSNTELREQLIKEKFERAKTRGHYRSIDLFAGCGGLTLGFDRAGIKCVSAIEIDDKARESHEINFKRDANYRAYSDIIKTTPEEAVSHIDEEPQDVVDIVVGGPPCQAFSRLGRAALWDLAGKKDAHAEDPRATMYEHFLEYVAKLQPLAFVMENVREMGKFAGKNIAHEIAVTADQLGYTAYYTVLNAVWFGTPQLRERLIIIGIAKELDIKPEFPTLTHAYEIPVGYSTSRSGTGRIDVLPPHDYYIDHFLRSENMRPAVTAEMAFADLPKITHHLDGRPGKGHRRDVNKLEVHKDGVTNEFIQQMTNWDGFESEGASVGHVIRYTPRDYETFRRMQPGDMYPEALKVAESIFEERLNEMEQKMGTKIEEGSELWLELKAKTVPPYKINRYPNKFRKMWADHPARTLPAHLGKDSYSHIHFDDDQARSISVREAARLQSFPDAFKFAGSMNAQLKQIGNAVPPLLSYNIAKKLREVLELGNTTNIEDQTIKEYQMTLNI